MRVNRAIARRPWTRSSAGALAFTLAAACMVALVVASLDVRLGLPATVLAEGSPTPSVPPPIAQLFHTKWYTQSTDLELAPGDVGTVTIVLRNVGHTDWVRDTPAEVRIGEIGGAALPENMRVGWLAPDRPAAQSESRVGEQGLATFTFNVKGDRRGVFRLALRPVLDGVAWLEDEGIHVDIWVR